MSLGTQLQCRLDNTIYNWFNILFFLLSFHQPPISEAKDKSSNSLQVPDADSDTDDELSYENITFGVPARAQPPRRYIIHIVLLIKPAEAGYFPDHSPLTLSQSLFPNKSKF